MIYVVEYFDGIWCPGGTYHDEEDAIRRAWALHFAYAGHTLDVKVTQREEKIIFTVSHNSQMFVRGRDGA